LNSVTWTAVVAIALSHCMVLAYFAEPQTYFEELKRREMQIKDQQELASHTVRPLQCLFTAVL